MLSIDPNVVSILATLGIAGFLAKQVWDMRRLIDQVRLDCEQRYQPRQGLREMVTEAVQVGMAPISAKLNLIETQLENTKSEAAALRSDVRILLDKFEVPAVQRHARG